MISCTDNTMPSFNWSSGPKGEGGLDDATGASGAAGGASMKQSSNAFDLCESLCSVCFQRHELDLFFESVPDRYARTILFTWYPIPVKGLKA
jgi:hypothetical protein